MKRVLLLSYYYPPYTGIEGNRVSSWASSLVANGFQVTVVTRQWKVGGQHEWKDYFSEYIEGNTSEETVNENLRVLRVPYKWGRKYKAIASSSFSSIMYWYYKAKGDFHIETDAYNALKGTAVSELRKQSYDFILVSSPPLNIIKLGVDLKNEFKLPLVADFRDSYNNYLLNPTFQPPFKARVETFFFRHYLKKWLRKSDIITSVSDSVLQTLPLAWQQKQVVIMNGYGNDAINNEPIRSKVFTISYVGSLYPNQQISFMAEGFSNFLQKVNSDKVLIRFIGLKSGVEVRRQIEAHIEKKHLFFSDRVLRSEALQHMRTSDLLLQVGWPGFKGLIPGKVFEYLASRRDILVAPGDGDLTDRIVKETNAGVSVNTIEEMVNYLLERYREWENNGCISYNGIWAEIEKYSRENQNLKLINELNSFQ
jgi:glycosyltransferase involved in cell wall biosynthesis